MINGSIYRITNKINGKIYIGQTIQKPEKRWIQHTCKRTGYTMIIGRAIQKYGKENFSFEVIVADINNAEDLTKEEINQVLIHNSVVPNGYNLIKPSESSMGHSEQSKEKISNSLKKYNIENKETITILTEKRRGVKRGKNTSSVFVGVHKNKENYFVSGITVSGKRITLGTYENEEDAAKVYDFNALKLFGRDAKLNFPELKENYLIETFILPKSGYFKSKAKNYTVCYLTGKNRWRVRIKGGSDKHFKTKDEALRYLSNPDKSISESIDYIKQNKSNTYSVEIKKMNTYKTFKTLQEAKDFRNECIKKWQANTL